MKRPIDVRAKGKGAAKAPQDALLGKFPCLMTYLTDDKWDDGKPREVSTLSVRIEGVEVHVTVNDKALARSLYTAAGSLLEALELVEEALSQETASWRCWKGRR